MELAPVPAGTRSPAGRLQPLVVRTSIDSPGHASRGPAEMGGESSSRRVAPAEASTPTATPRSAGEPSRSRHHRHHRAGSTEESDLTASVKGVPQAWADKPATAGGNGPRGRGHSSLWKGKGHKSVRWAPRRASGGALLILIDESVHGVPLVVQVYNVRGPP
jgi:hypothetical protein